MKLTRTLAVRNLRSDRFGTLAAVLGVALGVATVNTVLVLDENTRTQEAHSWRTNPDLQPDLSATVGLVGLDADGNPREPEDASEETHEDYQVMRSAIRLGSLSAFLVGALIVFFTFAVVIERRRREVALLRSLGARPRQVAAVFVLEAALVGLVGAALGYILTIPLSELARGWGISTTGRTHIYSLWFPWKTMAAVALVGAATAILGVARPVWSLTRMDLARTLRPSSVPADGLRSARRRASGFVLIAIPFMALMYVLIRPFFREVLPSLWFFVVEAGLVCAGFLATLVLVPDVVQRVGSALAGALPGGPAAERLVTLRRVRYAGHDLAWAVSGLMMVFSLLLALHLVTHALKREVVVWAEQAIRPYAFLFTEYGPRIDPARLPMPDRIVGAPFSGRTPWPNPVRSVDRDQLVRFAEATGRAELPEIAKRLGPGRALLSPLMARRLDVSEGDRVRLTGRGGDVDLEVVAVTEALGYVPINGPYRNAKNYVVLDARDHRYIAPYVAPLGSAWTFVDPAAPDATRWGRTVDGREIPSPAWQAWLGPARSRSLQMVIGARFEQWRVGETDRDFAIFDVILALTTILAALGVTNNLVLGVHGRRREIGLYRVLGMLPDQVSRLFLMEGAFVGLLGGTLAVVLGLPLGIAAIGALKVISAFDVTLEIPPMYAVLTIVGATLTALLSALYPAGLAARANSAESVHYE